jgi:glutaredoxin
MTQKLIRVYTQSGCEPCERTKQYLQDKKVYFKEYDIKDKGNYLSFRALGGACTPLIVINGKRIVGFNLEEIEKALKAYS